MYVCVWRLLSAAGAVFLLAFQRAPNDAYQKSFLIFKWKCNLRRGRRRRRSRLRHTYLLSELNFCQSVGRQAAASGSLLLASRPVHCSIWLIKIVYGDEGLAPRWDCHFKKSNSIPHYLTSKERMNVCQAPGIFCQTLGKAFQVTFRKNWHPMKKRERERRERRGGGGRKSEGCTST